MAEVIISMKKYCILLVMLRSLSSGHVCAKRRNIASAVTADSLAIHHKTMVREPGNGKSHHSTHGYILITCLFFVHKGKTHGVDI